MLSTERITQQNQQLDATDGLTDGQIHELIHAGLLASTSVPPSGEHPEGTIGVLICSKPLLVPGGLDIIADYERQGLELPDYGHLVFITDHLIDAQQIADGRGFGETVEGPLCALITADDEERAAQN